MKKMLSETESKRLGRNAGSLLFSGLVEMAGHEAADSISSNEKALLMIVRELDRYSELPYRKPIQKRWNEACFRKWALEEILELVWDRPWTPASETAWAFQMLCQNAANAAVLDEQKKIFSIAEKTASKILRQIEEVEQC